MGIYFTWWRHQMESFSALLDLCAWNSPVTGEFPSQRPVTQSFDVFFDPRLDKQLGKQSWGLWFETPSRSLWRHCKEFSIKWLFGTELAHLFESLPRGDKGPCKVHNQYRGSWWRHQMETFSALLAICAGNSPVPVNSTHKGQWRGALMFTLICARMNGWVNNREAGDLRRYHTHYDVIVMYWWHDARSHGISSHGIQMVLLEYSGFCTSRFESNLDIHISEKKQIRVKHKRHTRLPISN